MLNHFAGLAVILGFVIGSFSQVAAQADPQTEDWGRQDQRYLERLKKAEQQDRNKPRTPAEIREDYIRQARELIRNGNYAVKKTPHYIVRTDDPRVDPEAAATLLERFREHFIGYWSGEVEMGESTEPSPVFMFYSFYKYNKLLTGEKRFGEARPAGHYRPGLDVISLYTDASPLDELAGSLVHEAAHQLAENILFPPGSPRPDWLDEGLASYFGYDGLRAMGERSRSLAKNDGKASPRAGRVLLDELREALKDRKNPFSVIELMDMDSRTEFYGNRIRVHYGASWALVHYLLEGEDGGYRESFIRHIIEDPSLSGGSSGLLEVLGVDAETFTAGFAAHARKMKP